MSSFLKLLVLTVFIVGRAFGANIAIVDSGVDYKHKDLSAKIWTNPNNPPKTIDADGTQYDGDLNGWNFADHNNQIIDYKYLGTFSPDCTKMFEVQGKILRGTATDAEKAWYQSKKNDAEFLKELQKFGNFVHGTHVSGISSQVAEKAHLVGVKIIPTETPGAQALLDRMREQGDPTVEFFLMFLAQQQAGLLTTVGKYVAAVKADVANGSFGTSVAAVKPVIENLVKQLTGHDPSADETKEYSIYFINQLIDAEKTFVTSAPNTLFVFAAGNDGTNNDSIPEAPANIKTDNTIAVAASFGDTSLATFSCYGQKMVEVAAPGVVIRSTIPGDQYLEMSGTSMAAPFVTNVAGLVKDANHNLSPADIKRVLVQTVDVKSFLSGKVASSGIVNRERAVRAAILSASLGVEAAIIEARKIVADAQFLTAPMGSDKDLLVLPLPSLF